MTATKRGCSPARPHRKHSRYLVHEATTKDTEEEDKVLMLNDVARAFFEAEATRQMCIELPDEDPTQEERVRGTVGLLKKKLLRHERRCDQLAAGCSQTDVGVGLKRGKAYPCL